MTRRMQPVNLASVITAHKNLSDTNRDNLFKAWGISPKQKELVSLEALIDGISKLAPYSPEIECHGDRMPRGQVSGMRKRQSCNFHF